MEEGEEEEEADAVGEGPARRGIWRPRPQPREAESGEGTSGVPGGSADAVMLVVVAMALVRRGGAKMAVDVEWRGVVVWEREESEPGGMA